jgi:hypothetical protein
MPRCTTALLQLKGGTFVTLDLQNNRFNLSGTPLAAAAATAAGATATFTADLSGVVVEGTVLSTSLISTETLSMVGVGAANKTTVFATAQVRRPAGCHVGGVECGQADLGKQPNLGRTNAVAHATLASPYCRPLQGSTLTLSLTLDWVLVSTYNTTFGASTIQGVSNYAFSGQLVAEVGLGVCLFCNELC